jgi:hypothetical protein
VKQFHCCIHVALLDACYNAVLAHQELEQQGVAAGPFPMFPMEKLAEGYRHRYGSVGIVIWTFSLILHES